MTSMLDWVAPDGEEMLIVWLTPLGECRTERPTGAVLPFIMVRRVGGGFNGIVDNGRYAVSVFAADQPAAYAKSMEVHRRIALLAGTVGQQKVATSAGDVWADNVITREGFRLQDHLDNALPQKIYRYTAIYEIPMRLILA